MIIKLAKKIYKYLLTPIAYELETERLNRRAAKQKRLREFYIEHEREPTMREIFKLDLANNIGTGDKDA